MIFPEIVNEEHRNYKGVYTGCDSPKYFDSYPKKLRVKAGDQNLKLEDFLAYPHKINYDFNSRGFRDEEWPENLNDCYFCIGDSQVAGIGIPYKNMFVNILQTNLQKRIINCGNPGGNNYYWIVQKSRLILDTLKIKKLILVWGPAHRNHFHVTVKSPLALIKNSSSPRNDINTLKTYVDTLEKNKKTTELVHVFTKFYHDAYGFLDDMKKARINFVTFDKLDYGRDGIHYGIESNLNLAKKLRKKLK